MSMPMYCEKCGYKSPKGIYDLFAVFHHDCIMRNKCPLLKSNWEVVEDDKNWDWNEEFNLIIHKLQRHLTPEQLAPIVNQLLGIHDKLRDLILKHSDYADCLGNEQVVPVSKIKEIFGELK